MNGIRCTASNPVLFIGEKTNECPKAFLSAGALLILSAPYNGQALQVVATTKERDNFR